MRQLNKLKEFTVLSGKFAAKHYPGARYLQKNIDGEALLFNCGGYCLEDMEDVKGAETDAIEAGIAAGIAKASGKFDEAEELDKEAEAKKEAANEKRRAQYAAKKAAEVAAKAEQKKKESAAGAKNGTIQGAPA